MSVSRIGHGLWLAPWAAAAIVAPAAAAPVHITASEQGDSARLTARWEDGRITAPQVEADLQGNTLLLRFAEPIDADVGSLTTLAPDTIASAAVEGQNVRIALKRPLAARATLAGESYILTLDPKAEKPKAAATEASASDAVMTVGVRKEFTRLSFLFQTAGATVIPVLKGDTLDIKFNRAVDVDISQLKIMPPQFIKSAEKTSKPGAPLSIRLTLDPGVRQRSFVEGPRVVVDILPPDEKTLAAMKAKPPPPPPKAAEYEPAPPGGVVRVQMTEGSEATTLTTRWARPARVAAFRRGEALWILFDSRGRFDLRDVPRVGRRHQDVQQVNGDGVIALRIPTQPNMLITAKAEGNLWTFSIAPRAGALPATADLEREMQGEGARLTADFKRPGVVRWIADPEIGDMFGAALLDGPVIGVDTRRATLEAAIMPAAQGAGIDPRADGVGAKFEGNKLVVTRGAGLIASAAAPAPAAAAAGPLPMASSRALLDLSAWGVNDKRRAIEVLAQLQRTASEEGFAPEAKADARMNLARFLLANELAPETLGALRAAALNQPTLDLDPQYKLMRAAANLMMGRVRDAQGDLSAGVLAEDSSAALWRGYAAALTENWAEARRQLEQGQGALGALPQNWRARFNLALAQSALELNDFPAADAALAKGLGEASSEDLRARGEMLRARLLEARGDLKGALGAFQAVQASPDEAAAVRAILETTRLQRGQGLITASMAIDTLEALRFRWRGDGLELEVIQTLGRIYQDEGRWREGLQVMHAAAARFPDLPASRRIRMDMAEAFERLFLEGEADKLQPIQALGLFYEFKDLTPIGPDGDRMIRMLSARLVSVDLLPKATELLQYQIDNRLEGVGQAQVAADLAAIYLADRQPEKALIVIEATRQPGVPGEIASTRRVVEARALIDLGRFDHAMELIEKDQSVDAVRVRAEAAWRQKKWTEAVKWTWVVLERGPKGGDLSAEERLFVLRTAIACVLADDNATIAKLRATYAKPMAASPDAAAFELVTSGVEPGDVRLRDVAKQIARVDLVERVLSDIKRRLEKPVVSSKGTPVAQAGAAPPAG